MSDNRFKREEAVLEQLKEDEALWDIEPFIDLALDLEALSEEALSDVEGFIEYSLKHDMSPGYIASQVVHDLHGLRSKDPTFSPRTGDYAKQKEAYEGVSS